MSDVAEPWPNHRLYLLSGHAYPEWLGPTPTVPYEVARLRHFFRADQGYELAADETLDRAGIGRFLTALAGGGPDEVAVVYVMGHGLRSRTGGTFLPTTDGSRALSAGRILRAILRRPTPPAAVWLVLDCCHAGGQVPKDAKRVLEDWANRVGSRLAARTDRDPRVLLWAASASGGATYFGALPRALVAASSHLGRPRGHEREPIDLVSLHDKVQGRLERRSPTGFPGQSLQGVVLLGKSSTTFLRSPLASVSGARTNQAGGLLRARLGGAWDRKRRGLGPGDIGTDDHFVGRTAQLASVLEYLSGTPDGGPPFVVAGGPGTGKSALLGRALLLSDPDTFELDEGAAVGQPDQLQRAISKIRWRVSPQQGGEPPVGIDLHGRSGAEVDDALCETLEALPESPPPEAQSAPDDVPNPPARPDGLSERLWKAILRRRPPLLLVCDSLDEARTPLPVADLLTALASAPHVRLVVGVRPPLDQVFTAGGPLRWGLELGLGSEDDIATLVVRRLRRLSDKRHPDAYCHLPEDDDWLARLGRGVAERARGSFLYAMLASRVLARRKPIPRGAVESLPTHWEHARDIFEIDLLMHVCPEHYGAESETWLLDRERPARGDPEAEERLVAAVDLLRPLAWALGDGLPGSAEEDAPNQVWQSMAQGMRQGASIRARRVRRWVLRPDSPLATYVLPVGVGPHVRYRLWHEEMATFLREWRQESLPPGGHSAAERHAHSRVVDALLTCRGPDGRDIGPDDPPEAAPHPYVCRHLVQHAEGCGRVPQVLANPTFLCHSDPRTTAPAVFASGDAQAPFRVYLYAAERLARTRTAAERSSLLELAAMELGEQDVAALHARSIRDRPWSPVMASGPTTLVGYSVPDSHSARLLIASGHGIHEEFLATTTKSGVVWLRPLRSSAAYAGTVVLLPSDLAASPPEGDPTGSLGQEGLAYIEDLRHRTGRQVLDLCTVVARDPSTGEGRIYFGVLHFDSTDIYELPRRDAARFTCLQPIHTDRTPSIAERIALAESPLQADAPAVVAIVASCDLSKAKPDGPTFVGMLSVRELVVRADHCEVRHTKQWEVGAIRQQGTVTLSNRENPELKPSSSVLSRRHVLDWWLGSLTLAAHRIPEPTDLSRHDVVVACGTSGGVVRISSVLAALSSQGRPSLTIVFRSPVRALALYRSHSEDSGAYLALAIGLEGVGEVVVRAICGERSSWRMAEHRLPSPGSGTRGIYALVADDGYGDGDAPARALAAVDGASVLHVFHLLQGRHASLPGVAHQTREVSFGARGPSAVGSGGADGLAEHQLTVRAQSGCLAVLDLRHGAREGPSGELIRQLDFVPTDITRPEVGEPAPPDIVVLRSDLRVERLKRATEEKGSPGTPRESRGGRASPGRRWVATALWPREVEQGTRSEQCRAMLVGARLGGPPVLCLALPHSVAAISLAWSGEPEATGEIAQVRLEVRPTCLAWNRLPMSPGPYRSVLAVGDHRGGVHLFELGGVGRPVGLVPLGSRTQTPCQASVSHLALWTPGPEDTHGTSLLAVGGSASPFGVGSRAVHVYQVTIEGAPGPGPGGETAVVRTTPHFHLKRSIVAPTHIRKSHSLEKLPEQAQLLGLGFTRPLRNAARPRPNAVLATWSLGDLPHYPAPSIRHILRVRTTLNSGKQDGYADVVAFSGLHLAGPGSPPSRAHVDSRVTRDLHFDFDGESLPVTLPLAEVARTLAAAPGGHLAFAQGGEVCMIRLHPHPVCQASP